MSYQDFVAEFERTVEAEAARLGALSEEESGRRPAPGRWSAKETVGHLIDSAANNHQRFVRAQNRPDLDFPGYEQDEWIAAQHYQSAPWPRLVELWRLYNLHLAHLCARIPDSELRRPRHPHSLDRIAFRLVPAGQPATLEYLVRDYFDHLRHHLAQIVS